MPSVYQNLPSRKDIPGPAAFGRAAMRDTLESGSAFWKGIRFSSEGTLIGLPLMAAELATCKRGELLPTATGRGAGLLLYPAITGITMSALTLLTPFSGGTTAILASLLALYPDTVIENMAISRIRRIGEEGKYARRFQFGGDFQDTQSALALRQRAVRDMSGAHTTARRYLGHEASLLHR